MPKKTPRTSKRYRGGNLEAEIKQCHRRLEKKIEEVDYLTEQVNDMKDTIKMLEVLYRAKATRMEVELNDSPKKYAMTSYKPKPKTSTKPKRSSSKRSSSRRSSRRSSSIGTKSEGHRGSSPVKMPGLF